MQKTAVLLYPQFSEYEVSVALSILMQGEKPVMTIGMDKLPIKGESGLSCVADTTYAEANLEEIDSLLLPGCMDIMAIGNQDGYIDFIKQAAVKAKVIAGISSSPLLLAKAGVLTGKKYTAGLTKQFMEASGVFDLDNYSQELVVQDGNLITARGRGFIKFASFLGRGLNLEFDERWYRE
ncbi:DJ-1/PfpI family protein [Bacillus sp. REN3]|uniref:DJ-1/PfpI family protein n=1 Tax=Bacillus sp. REN3 TaxID=2802440 RepID=UPI001AED5F17|nr:DJ-1/PfpI family protein [Bacillus sp. REN3]